jgi:hypothetical protein
MQKPRPKRIKARAAMPRSLAGCRTHPAGAADGARSDQDKELHGINNQEGAIVKIGHRAGK